VAIFIDALATDLNEIHYADENDCSVYNIYGLNAYKVDLNGFPEEQTLALDYVPYPF